MRKIFYEFQCFDENDFAGDDMVNINDILPLSTVHFRNVGSYIFSKVKYISVEQWIQYSIYNDKIIGSRVFEIKKIIGNNVQSFNTLMYLGEKVEIKKQPILVENYDDSFVTVEYNLYNWFYNNYYEFVNNLIRLKVLYSSFF